MRVLINNTSVADFTKILLTTLAEQKTPVLLPNLQEGTLQKFSAEYDLMVGESLKNPQVSLNDLNPEQEIIFFTSGTTGEPKKISKKLKHLLNEVQVIEKMLGSLAQDCKIYSTVSCQHIYGLLFSVLWPMWTQRKTSVITYPEELKSLEDKKQSYILISSPAFLKRMDPLEDKLSYCKLVTSSGGKLEQEAAAKTKQIFGMSAYEILGSTETGGVAYRQGVEAWTALPGVKIRCDSEDRLVVASDFFSETEIQMGDCVQMLNEQSFRLKGRSDRIVKIEGKRISLEEVEKTLLQHPGVSEAAAINQEHFRDQINCALVLNNKGLEQLKTIGEVELKKIIKDYLLQFFDRVTLPKKIRFVAELPRNDQAKLLQSQMQELFND